MSNTQQHRITMNTMNSLSGYVTHQRLQPLSIAKMFVGEPSSPNGTSRGNSYIHHLCPEDGPNLHNSSPSDQQQQPCSIEWQNKPRKNLSKLKLPFPWKLHQLLDDLECEGRQDIASWLPGGRSFRIHNPEAFSKDIMSNYFRQTKFASFIRQVRFYYYV
jgi:hypothetical protein